MKQVMSKELLITTVYHDLDDDGWQFIPNIETSMDDAMVVSLEEVVQIDSSVLEVAHIKPGFHAWRSDATSKWRISETKPDETE